MSLATAKKTVLPYASYTPMRRLSGRGPGMLGITHKAGVVEI